MADVPKVDWKEMVEKSNGQAFFVPEELQPMVSEWLENRKKLKELTAVAAEQEVKTSVSMQNMFLALREYAVKKGVEDVWTSDIGFDTRALAEGVQIVNLVDAVGK